MKLSLRTILAPTATLLDVGVVIDAVRALPGVVDVQLVAYGDAPADAPANDATPAVRAPLATARPREATPSNERARATGSTGSAPVDAVSKSDFIRMHPNKSNGEVAALAAKAGMVITPNVVASTRFRDRERAASKAKASSKKGGR